MLSTFSSLNMGMRALSAFSLGMQTVGNNISNIDTEGYSRQKVIYNAAAPMDLQGMGQLGQGVEVESIVRIRDAFLDYQYRMNAASGGYWEKLDAIYQAIEKYFPEPLNDGISTAISDFFSSVQILQQRPEDTATRAALVGSAETLGGLIGTLSEQIDTLTRNLNQQVLSSVDEVNGILHKIATLNYEITKAEALDQNANSLLDQRDLLLDQLSGIVDVTFQEPLTYGQTQGEFWVTLNGRALVQGNHVRELVAHPFQWNEQVYYDVQVAENEFNIVDNCYVADVLATGPEGVYQLLVDRVANGAEWEVGGGDAQCLDTTSVTSQLFVDDNITSVTWKTTNTTDASKILTKDSTKDEKQIVLSTTDASGNDVQITVKINWQEEVKDASGNITTSAQWILTATDLAGNSLTSNKSANTDLTVSELASYIDGLSSAFSATNVSNELKITTTKPLSFSVSSGLLTEDSRESTGGVILSGSSDQTITRKLEIRTTDNPPAGTEAQAIQATININWVDGSGWTLSATDLGNSSVAGPTSYGNNLTVKNIEAFITSIKLEGLKVKAMPEGTNLRLAIWAENASGEPKSIEFTDYSGMLGALSTTTTPRPGVLMRSRPKSVDEALGLSGSFRIQVGSQGTRVASSIFKQNTAAMLDAGQVLGKGNAGDKYTFRVSVKDEQADITVTWNDSTGDWILSSDRTLKTMTAETAGALSISDIVKFLKMDNVLPKDLNVTSGRGDDPVDTQFAIESGTNHLISINDVTGNLAEKLGIVNKNPIITIDVGLEDSLQTVCNKINEKYQDKLGLTEPEQWVHASLKQDEDMSWYLTIAADVAGEAQRITLMGAKDGNMQVLRRLGLTATLQQPDGSYREVTRIAQVSEDASFNFNGARYLSSDNMFNTARRIPAPNSHDYSATTLSEVQEGMWFNLKHTGSTTITVKHHVQSGTVKALEEVRDNVIPNMKGKLNELAYELVTHFNAYQYSGYGIGKGLNTTGVAFFDPLSTKAGAADSMKVSEQVSRNHAFIGAAMGKKDDNGIASYGTTGGVGDGTNAMRLAQLGEELIMNGTSSLVNFYNGLLTEVGSDSSYATLMNTAQQNILAQINAERDSVSGVNLEEELVNIVLLNRCYGAMARYVTTIDQMLDTLINGFGVVGR